MQVKSWNSSLNIFSNIVGRGEKLFATSILLLPALFSIAVQLRVFEFMFLQKG